MRYVLLVFMITLFFTGCGGPKELSEDEVAEYQGNIKVMDLLDEDSYQQDGKEMVKALETALSASPNDFHMLNLKSQNLLDLFSYAGKFEETFEDNQCDYYYVGKMKDGKPHGFGVLTDSYETETMAIEYIGEFKDGKVDDCYGIKLNEYRCVGDDIGEYTYVVYEGIMQYFSTQKSVQMIDGEYIIPFDLGSVYDDSFPYETLGLSKTNVAVCIPLYIGEIENGQYEGKGILYSRSGSIMYEGEFKNGQYHGEGKLYSWEGELQEEGTFKYGKLEEGKIYRE